MGYIHLCSGLEETEFGGSKVKGAGSRPCPPGYLYLRKKVIPSESKSEWMPKPLCPRSRGDKAILKERSLERSEKENY